MIMINARPAEWFGPEHAGMLAQYCRHKIQADLVAQQLQAFDPAWLADDDGLQRFDKLSAMQDRESKTITALLRSMRLTQQSMIRADKVVRNTRGRKPWQIDHFQPGQSDHLTGSIDQIDPCLAVQLDQIDPVVSG
jgi:hypothetical protein